MFGQVYQLAAFLGSRFDARNLVAVRDGDTDSRASARRAAPRISGPRNPTATLDAIDLDLAEADGSALPVSALRRSVVVCVDALEHSDSPVRLIRRLADLARAAPLTIVTGALADGDGITAGRSGPGLRWTPCEFDQLLALGGLMASLRGVTSDAAAQGRVNIAIADQCPLAAARAIPDSFQPLALMAAYNEADIAPQTVMRLVDDGFEVHVADNWSTDGTFEAMRALARDCDRLTVGRFPPEGPDYRFDYVGILAWKEKIGGAHPGRWIANVDSDEIRCSPWTGISFRGGLYVCDLMGFNAVDFTVLNFMPTDDRFTAGMNPERTLRHFEFGLGAYSCQARIWKQGGRLVDLRNSGGHEARFEGRRVFPYKFVLKHFPLRSSGHAHRKIFMERRPRYRLEERALGWHSHYDHCTPSQSPLRDASSLLAFDDASTPREHVVALVSGIGSAVEHASGPSPALEARPGTAAPAVDWPEMPDEGLVRASTVFETEWYLRSYPDVQQAGVDPVRHYLLAGAAEGRDPGNGFSTRGYLAQNADVARSGMNPLVHYLQVGRSEGRRSGLDWHDPTLEPPQTASASPRLRGHRLTRRVLEHAGVRVSLDLSSRLESHGAWIRMIDAGWERAVFEFLGAELREGDVFLDVGASVGPFSILAAHQVGAAGRVVAMEPDPFAIVLLRHNLALNGCCSVAVSEAALHHHDELVGLRKCREWGDSQTRTVSIAEQPDLIVRGTTLQSLCRDFGIRPTALKIDIEGGERVLLDREAWRIVQEARVVLLEVHTEALGADFAALRAAIGELAGNGGVDVVELERRSEGNFNLGWRRP
jgi:FkbM family methyltransferase